MARKSKSIRVGDKVIWHDPGIDDFAPGEREEQLLRVFTVDEIDDEIALISDGFGEAEVFPHELEKIE